MIYMDNVIEKNQVFLYNLNNNPQNTTAGVWSTPNSGYGFYSIPYAKPLILEHFYYYRCIYKFTTTNQSPTWCIIYNQGGMKAVNWASLSNPEANTEYIISGIGTPGLNGPDFSITSGTIYNGPSNAINGVSSSVKDVICYDVTELYEILRAKGVVTTEEALKNWCDENLDYQPKGIQYNISSKINETSTKIYFHKGTTIVNDIVEADGMAVYSNSSSNYKVRNSWFDNTDDYPVSIYNNKGNGTVNFSLVSAESVDSPFKRKHPNVLKITTNGTASPGAGGFVATHMAKEKAIFVEKFVAKIPTGYQITAAYNNQGTGNSVTYLSDRSGDDSWKEYTILYKCGTGTGLSTGGHVYITGNDNTNVTWYVAYVNNCEITDKEYLKNYTVLNNKLAMKDGHLFTDIIDCCNILPNGDCSNREANMLPAGWTYDTTDYAGNAKCSLVQPVGAGAGEFGGYLAIDPSSRYKISYWVKCKRDMTNFLTAFIPSRAKGSGILDHTSTAYVNGTKTTLTADLKSGDTTVTVSNNANWKDRAYSSLGFRSSLYYGSYNDKGISNTNGSTGMVAGITGTTTINLKKAYSGNTIPKGTIVVESYDGGTYPYPITKDSLPTDNEWHYVEGAIGTNGMINDGRYEWAAFPCDARYLLLRLNIYSNTGSVPIKFSDIRIERVGDNYGNRRENKIQIKEVIK